MLLAVNGTSNARTQAILSYRKRMQVLPVKVRDKELDLPSWLGNLQYLHLKDLGSDYSAVAKRVLSLLE